MPRRTSQRLIRTTANEDAFHQSKSLELEQRVARLELLITDLAEAVDVINKRTAAMQAQMDHFSARLGRL